MNLHHLHLAGFFDAVGHIDVEQERGHLPLLKLRVTHQNEEALRGFYLWFGGSFNKLVFRPTRFQWTIEGPTAVEALEQMAPDLTGRLRDEAEHALSVMHLRGSLL
ncbi:MAG TPA: hypothetical protein VLA89_17355, partial [Gemmatimonadales bacterium]|nr:hypothetical protein [Gemmatimonadales bacterium]